jgi:hypothetical protein
MVRLPTVLAAWGQPAFEKELKEAIARLDCSELPLQAGLAAGSFALEDPLDVMIINAAEKDDCVETKVGIFYQSLTPGCACAGDPTVESEQNEHITVLVSINKQTAAATFQLVDD